MGKWIIAAIFMCALVAPAAAQEIVAGRPGNTESPVVVPAAHWQIESELVSFARHDDADAESLSLVSTAFRYGVGANWDAEIIVSPLNRVEVGGDEDSGFGDITLRVRRQLSAADSNASYAIVGYLTLPTASDNFGADDPEFGAIATGAFDLSSGSALTLTGGIGAASADDDYDLRLFGGASYAIAINGRTGLYGELFADRVDGETQGVLQAGVTHLLSERTQIDGGVEFGLTDEADDFRVFVGWSRLF